MSGLLQACVRRADFRDVDLTEYFGGESIGRSGVSLAGKAVLGCIADSSNDEGYSLAEVRQADMAYDLMMSEETVRKWITIWERIGLVEKYGDCSAHKNNPLRYKLNVDALIAFIPDRRLPPSFVEGRKALRREQAAARQEAARKAAETRRNNAAGGAVEGGDGAQDDAAADVGENSDKGGRQRPQSRSPATTKAVASDQSDDKGGRQRPGKAVASDRSKNKPSLREGRITRARAREGPPVGGHGAAEADHGANAVPLTDQRLQNLIAVLCGRSVPWTQAAAEDGLRNPIASSERDRRAWALEKRWTPAGRKAASFVPWAVGLVDQTTDSSGAPWKPPNKLVAGMAKAISGDWRADREAFWRAFADEPPPDEGAVAGECGDDGGDVEQAEYGEVG